MKRDLYSDLKGKQQSITFTDFKESIFDLVENTLKLEKGLTQGQKQAIARLRSYIEIQFKDL